MAIYSKLIEGLTNDETYFAKVFTVNPEGRVNNRADLPFASVIPSAFPKEPTGYSLLETVSAYKAWTAPADGYYRIEVFGASGSGGAGGVAVWSTGKLGSGGSGGGGGTAISIVKLKKGDTITITCGTVGKTTLAIISSQMEVYDRMLVTSGENGTECTLTSTDDGYSNGVAGTGGKGGVAFGGNVNNYNGGNGRDGEVKKHGGGGTNSTISGPAGGSAGYTGGNIGGAGGGAEIDEYANGRLISPGTGAAGFVKIFAGNTNVA